MTAKEIFELRKKGHAEEAYESARQLYATDKSPAASSAMFWTANDVFRARIDQGRIEEATKILMALRRLQPNVPDKDGWVKTAYERCEQLLARQHAKADNDGGLAQHSQMGIWGEEVAAAYLCDKGYTILERNWHSGHRDIDIIAQQGGTLVFVEVKTRRNTEYGTPEHAVDWQKRRNLRHAANHYIHYRRLSCPTRFDIVTVVGSLDCEEPVIHHFEDVDIMR